MSAEELLGKTIAGGRYQILKCLGEGGMGAVYQARQVAMDRLVALKLIRTEMVQSQQAVARFHQEMRATAKIEHPNTIRVYDFGDSDGQLFLAMEFLAGETLHKVIESGPLPVARVLHIGAQIAKALGAAHSEGIVHRDLKPDNVMLLDRYGERDFVKVLDFGIARSLDENRTQMTAAGAIIGTPAYMSPEQGMGQEIDTRTDLYSLGIILYEMVGGVVPFNGPSLVSLLMAHATEAPRPIGELQPSVPAPLAELIMQLLAKTPAERPQTAGEVAARLEALASGSALANLTVPPTIQHARPPGAPLPSPSPSPSSSPSPPPSPSSKLPLAIVAGVLLVAGVAGGAWFLRGRGATPVDRAALDRQLAALGDPPAPLACRTRDATTIALLGEATAPGADAKQTAAALLAAGDPASAERAALLARAQLDSGSPAEAFASAKQAAELCKGYAFAGNLQGKAAQKSNRLDDAEIAYNAAIAAAPDYSAPRFNLGLLQLKRKDSKAALAQLTEIIKQNPAHPNVFLVRAQAWQLDGNLDNALADAETATIRAPSSADAWTVLASLRLQTHKGDVREAACRAKQLGNAAVAKLCP